MSSPDQLPRELYPAERDLLLWVLPADRSGYAEYRKYVEQWPVAAAGRGGEGSFILTESGWRVDKESPLPSLFAYGVSERKQGRVTVSVRERLGSQLEFELDGPLTETFEETRRWSFSEWLPSDSCPSCRSRVRETRMVTTTGQVFFLVICGLDRRIWVHSEHTGVNALIPLTGFYNELMLQTGVNDPVIALEPKRLFEPSARHSNMDLIRAFAAYNRRRNRLMYTGEFIFVEEERPSLKQHLFGYLRKH